jgi:hypothetical protein
MQRAQTQNGGYRFFPERLTAQNSMRQPQRAAKTTCSKDWLPGWSTS